MGELLALGSGFFFALSVIYLKIGQNARPNENGVFMTSLVNVGMFAILSLAAFLLGAVPPLTASAAVFFVIAGFTNTLIGRWSWLQSVRAIGPSRGTALKVCAPVFSAVLANVVLGQPLTLTMLAGIGIVIASVVLVSREAGSRASATVAPPVGDESAVLVPGPGLAGVIENPASGPRAWYASLGSNPVVLQGILLGLLSALAYGSGSVLRKLGLDTTPSPFVGALIGAVVATGSVLASDLARGNLGRRWQDNVREVPSAFVLAGVFAGVAQLAAFSALMFTTVARSATISSSQPMFAALLSLAFFRTLDTITPWSVVGMLGIGAGVAVVLFG